MHHVMIRIAIAIGTIATVGCSHANFLGNRQPHPSLAADSSFVSGDELWEDMRNGHSNLYDALKSTRPEILRSGSEEVQVYVDRPLGFGGCCDRIMDLRQISTGQVKWIRRYAPGTAPRELDYHAGVLLVTLR